MSKYTKEEQEFLDKAAIAYMQGILMSNGGYFIPNSENAYVVARDLLTERKKLYDE